MYFGWSKVCEWVKQHVVDAAKLQGLVLELSEIDMSLQGIHLRDARARLEGVEGLTAYLQNVDVDLSGFKPSRVQIGGVLVQTVGSPLDLKRAVQAWQSRHPAPATASAPAKPEIRNLKITWQALLNTAPFLELDEVTFAAVAKPYGPSGDDVAVKAEQARVGALRPTPLVVLIHNEAESVEIGLGGTTWDGLTVRGGWKSQLNGDELHVSLGPLAVGPLLAKMSPGNFDKALAAASLYGGLSLVVPRDERKPYQGYWALEVKGWTPPHPPELQGFPFGNSTQLDSAFEIDRALTSANLTPTRLTSGAFKLVGHARVSRSSLTSVRVQAELKGNIACTALAGAVAGSKLGQAYGQWVNQHAGQLVDGSVEVTTQVDADTGAIDRARVAKQVGVGCGLKPVNVQEMLSLGLPPLPDADLIKHLEKDLPTWSGQLPLMPTTKPPVQRVPDWVQQLAH